MKISLKVSDLWSEHYFQIKKYKEEYFCKIADGVMALILCIPSDIASYLFKYYENFFDSSKF